MPDELMDLVMDQQREIRELRTANHDLQAKVHRLEAALARQDKQIIQGELARLMRVRNLPREIKDALRKRFDGALTTEGMQDACDQAARQAQGQPARSARP